MKITLHSLQPSDVQLDTFAIIADIFIDSLTYAALLWIHLGFTRLHNLLVSTVTHIGKSTSKHMSVCTTALFYHKPFSATNLSFALYYMTNYAT